MLDLFNNIQIEFDNFIKNADEFIEKYKKERGESK